MEHDFANTNMFKHVLLNTKALCVCYSIFCLKLLSRSQNIPLWLEDDGTSNGWLVACITTADEGHHDSSCTGGNDSALFPSTGYQRNHHLHQKTSIFAHLCPHTTGHTHDAHVCMGLCCVRDELGEKCYRGQRVRLTER